MTEIDLLTNKGILDFIYDLNENKVDSFEYLKYIYKHADIFIDTNKFDIVHKQMIESFGTYFTISSIDRTCLQSFIDYYVKNNNNENILSKVVTFVRKMIMDGDVMYSERIFNQILRVLYTPEIVTYDNIIRLNPSDRIFFFKSVNYRILPDEIRLLKGLSDEERKILTYKAEDVIKQYSTY